MEAKFYLTEMEENVGRNGAVRLVPNVLFFSLLRPASTRDPQSPPTSFDGKATRDHVEQYREAYKAFKKLNPEYRCEWPELEVQVAAPVEVAPVPADEPVEE